MAKARRRRRAKRATKTTTRRRRKRNGTARAAAANPRRRRRGKKKNPTRAAAANPRRRRRRRAKKKNPTRAAAANPRRRARRASSRRGRRRNPGKSSKGLPLWLTGIAAGVLGIAGYAVANSGSFALTQRIDPSMDSLLRNRMIAGGLVGAGGVALAVLGKSSTAKLLGAGLAAAGAISIGGSQATIAVGKVIDKQGVSGLGSVMRSGNARALANANARAGGMLGMGAVEPAAAYPGMGNLAMTPPWEQGNPFGY